MTSSIRLAFAVLAGLTMAASNQAQAAPQTILVTNESGQALPAAAVSMFVKGTRAQTDPQTTANMAQRGRAFAPTLLVIQTGTSVLFPNFDTVRHHVYSFSAIKPFEIKLYAGTPAAPVVFDKPGTATLGCNIHDKMLSYIHVVDTPYFGVTDRNGQVTLDIPPGEHRLRVWMPSMGETNPGIEQVIKVSGQPLTARIRP
ncbi:MAG: methylamine utilization protein [Pseudomonadota bacterium]